MKVSLMSEMNTYDTTHTPTTTHENIFTTASHLDPLYECCLLSSILLTFSLSYIPSPLVIVTATTDIVNMFPSARNSVRRNGDHHNGLHNQAMTIPVPVGVTLHNFILLKQQEQQEKYSKGENENVSSNDTVEASSMAMNRASNNNKNINNVTDTPQRESSSSTRFFHPQHASSLLPRLHLDITVDDENADTAKAPENGGDTSTPTATVYSQALHHRSVHPSWEHLDEQTHVPSQISKCWWKDHDVYKSMRLKLSILPEENKSDEDETTITTDSKDNSTINSKSDNTTKIDFLDAPLHPSLLQRMDMGKIPSSAAASQDGSGLLDDDEDDDNLFGTSDRLPPLPPNTLLVHYSDGSIRCLPQLYQLLCERKHLSQAPPPIEDFDRFEDDVFKTLDHVQSTPQRRERTASSLLDQDQEEEEQRQQQQQQRISNGNGIQPSPSEDSQDKDVILQHLQQEQQEGELEDIMRKKQPKLTFPYSEEESLAEDLALQNEMLRLQIKREERLLEEETQCLRDEQSDLADLMQQLREVDKEVVLVKSELNKQVAQLQQDEVVKEAQCIKLIRDLKKIYPITMDTVATSASSSMAMTMIGGTNANNSRGTPGGYLIRGLRLPVDIYTTTVPEEEINASLGYCVHLVFMIAKYLTIQLRHRIFCNSSRSAIQQDGVGVFPLFLGRMVARSLEREQVDRGARLLGANVNCIMMHIDMPESLHQMHILARLKAILDRVADGDFEKSGGPVGSKGARKVEG